MKNQPKAYTPGTHILIRENQWWMNGKVLNPGAPAEGLLMNVRMANAVFEDQANPGFDPEENVRRFIAQIPDYRNYGICAFTICLQGGFPGYEGAVNTAFAPDGSLKGDYLERVSRVIEACDQQNIAVILGCFYQRQVKIFRDEDAVRAGIVNVARWINASGFTNVVVETTNEYGHRGYSDPLFITPEGQVELLDLFKQTAPGVLVSTSRQGHKGFHEKVCLASDFLLIHLNNVLVEDVPGVIEPLKQYGKPIVCNEDRKIGEEGARVAEVCVMNNCSWGFMTREVNQYHPPFRFMGHTDDPMVYAKLKELSQPR